MTQERQEAGEPGRPGEQVTEIRDGAIDFSRYSSEQLEELRCTFNASAFPLNYANLLAEIQHRATQPPPKTEPPPAEETPPSAPEILSVRFTPHDGVRGWLEAKSRRLPLYGEGFIEIRPQEIVLGGWQRNWLGIAHRTELFVPLETLTDVIQGDGGSSEQCREGDWVRFRYETPMGRDRFVEFQTASVQRARAIVEALPKTRSAGYERWTAIREFDARVREAGANPWITPALVLANVVVFVATALTTKHLDVINDPEMIAWGANLASLTLHGQWWRLVSALFLHANVPHVLFNMWALWNIGRLTERLYGNWAFAFLYFACGALSGLTSIVWDPTRGTVGASGAIFGICAAFIVFALHPHRRIAVKVPPALWISALIFALYNLIAGFFALGVDNAAHVGGVISGLALGACLARALTPEARRQFPIKRTVAAITLIAVGILAALWQATGFGEQLTGPERYARDHLWYFNGEAQNLRQWQEMANTAGSAQSGNLAERFEREILPFWQTSSARLKQEESTLPPDERQFAALLAEYARVRLELARATLDTVRGDQNRAADVTRYEKESNLVAGRVQRTALLANLQRPSRALNNSSWIVATRNWLTGQHWKCVEPPPLIRKSPSPEDSATDGPAARRAAGCRAQELFMTRDYVALEHWLEKTAATLHDLPDGGSTFDGIVGGLDDLFSYKTSDVVEMLGRTAEWQRRTPDSLYPRLSQSLLFDSWAWAARGFGPASSVSPLAWAMFAQRAEMAAVGLRELGEVGGRANKNPLWYELSLDVGLDQSRTLDELRGIFERGVAEYPDYWPLYSRILRILMPRWLGSQEEVRRFVMEHSETPDGQRDFEKYARMYWTYSSLEHDDVDLFGGSLAAWSVMREGLVELEQRYPKSDLIRNAYAKFACMANDSDTYNDIRSHLRGHISSTAWSNKISLEHCDKQFATAAAAASPRTMPPNSSAERGR